MATSLLDEVLDFLTQAFASGPYTLRGRVLDAAGEPIAGAAIAVWRLGALGGGVQATETTGADGSFAFTGPLPPRFRLDVSTGGRVRHSLAIDERSPTDVGDLRITVPIVLAAAVGLGQENRPLDVRRVQARLFELGRLTEAELAGEAIDPEAVPPVDLVARPRLLSALFDQIQAAAGRRAGPLRPGSVALAALNTEPAFPLAAIALSDAVGVRPGGAAPANAPADVRAVQDRLHQLGLLRADHYVAERVDPEAAAPVAPASVPRTIDAILALDRSIGGESHAVVPGSPTARALSDPPLAGAAPLELAGSVGAGGENRPRDVRRVQDRLLRIGRLSAADHAAEAVSPADGPAVDEAALPLTLAALGGRVDMAAPDVARLALPLALTARAIPGEIRALQQRLAALGFLSAADLAAEPVDPGLPGPVDRATLPLTTAALEAAETRRGPLELSAPVGPGERNLPGDVRRVQEQLAALGLLAAADLERERVDPAAPAPPSDTELTSTFAAVTALRQGLLGQPPPVAGRPWTALPRIVPGDDAHRMLRDPVYWGRGPLRLLAPVGRLGANRAGDVAAVQERLRELRLLSADDHALEAVAPGAHGPVREQRLQRTIAAIARLQTELAGAVETGRLEPRHPLVVALGNPLLSGRVALPLGGAVGPGAANAEADVRAVKERLRDLRVLEGEDEAALLAAIARWREHCGAEATLPIVPHDASHRLLERPLAPPPVAFALTGAVGLRASAGANRGPEVARVLDRLHELGLVATPDYAVERARLGSGQAALAAIPVTIAGIGDAQARFAGPPLTAVDRAVDVGGNTRSALEDPGHGAATRPNPHAADAAAGPAPPALAAPVRLIAAAIASFESVPAAGEAPARLRNASRTPATFGRAQLAAEAALEVLRERPAARWDHFTVPELDTLSALAQAVASRWDAVAALMPVLPTAARPALSEAQLVAEASQNAAAEAGLGREDIVRIWRAHQLIRHLSPHAVAADATEAARDAALAAAIPAGTDAAANVAALGLRTSDLRVLIAGPSRGHREGFVARALLRSTLGQRLRSVLTDAGGAKLAAARVAQLYDRVTATPGGLALAEEQRAQATAFLHRYGTGRFANVAAVVADVAAAPLPRPNPVAPLHVVEHADVHAIMARWGATGIRVLRPDGSPLANQELRLIDPAAAHAGTPVTTSAAGLITVPAHGGRTWRLVHPERELLPEGSAADDRAPRAVPAAPPIDLTEHANIPPDGIVVVVARRAFYVVCPGCGRTLRTVGPAVGRPDTTCPDDDWSLSALERAIVANAASFTSPVTGQSPDATPTVLTSRGARTLATEHGDVAVYWDESRFLDPNGGDYRLSGRIGSATVSAAIIGRATWGAKPKNTGPSLKYEFHEAKLGDSPAYATIAIPHSENLPLASVFHWTTIHHSTDTGASSFATPRALQQKHLDGKKDWKGAWKAAPRADIGYHLVIDTDGTVFEGRPLGIEGSHAELFNAGNVGIVLAGDFESRAENGWSPDTPTAAQLSVLDTLADVVAARFGSKSVWTHIERKKQAGSTVHTECPGALLIPHVLKLRAKYPGPPP